MFINQNDEGLSKMLITVPCTCLREQGFVVSICVITPHAQRERGKVIDRGVHIYIYMSVVEKKF